MYFLVRKENFCFDRKVLSFSKSNQEIIDLYRSMILQKQISSSMLDTQ